MAQSNLDIIIKVVDKASASAAKVTKGFKDMGAAAKKANSGMSAIQKQMSSFASIQKQKWEALNQPVQTFGEKLNAMKATFIAVAAVAVVAGVAIKKAFEFAKTGAGIERLETASGQLAESLGGDMEKIKSALKDASLGMVSDLDIMSGASRAMALGLGADSDKLAQLMQVAAFRARQFGLDTSTAFQDIVTGIGRMSPLILDNLGIVIDARTRYDEYAKSINKTTAELTSAEKRQALLNAVLEEGNKQIEEAGGLVLDAAGEYEKLEASITNLSNSFKRNLAPAITPVVSGLNRMLDAQFKLKRAVELGAITQIEANAILDSVRRGYMDYGEVLDFATQKVDQTNLSLESQANRLERMEEVTTPATEALEELTLTEEELAIAAEETSNWLKEVAAAAQAQREEAAAAALAVREQALAYWDLVEALSFATEAEAAKIAIEKINQLFKDGKIDVEQHAELIKGIGIEYGILTEKGIATEAAMAEFLDIVDLNNLSLEEGTRLFSLMWEEVEDGVFAAGDLEAAFEKTGRQVATSSELMDEKIRNINTERIDFLKNTMLEIETQSPTASSAIEGMVEGMNESFSTLDLGELTAAKNDLLAINATPRNMRFDISVFFSGEGGIGFSPEIPVVTPPAPRRRDPTAPIIGAFGATGLDFVVPPGFPNDSFGIGVQSGERVQVTPRGQTGGGGVVMHNTFNVPNEATAKIVAKTIARQLKRQGVQVV